MKMNFAEKWGAQTIWQTVWFGLVAAATGAVQTLINLQVPVLSPRAFIAVLGTLFVDRWYYALAIGMLAGLGGPAKPGAFVALDLVFTHGALTVLIWWIYRHWLKPMRSFWAFMFAWAGCVAALYLFVLIGLDDLLSLIGGNLFAGVYQYQLSWVSPFDMWVLIVTTTLCATFYHSSQRTLEDNRAVITQLQNEVRQRQESETAMRQSEARALETQQTMDAIYRNLPAAISISRFSDGKIIDVNPEYERLFGVSKGMALGQTSFSLGIMSAPERDEMYRRLRRDGKIDEMEVHLFSQTRGPIVALGAGLLVRLQGEPHLLAVVRDVTTLKKDEADLRKLWLAMEQSPTSVVITDRNGLIEYANPKFYELTGYTLAEALGQKPNILKSGFTTRAQYDELWQTILSGREWQGVFHNRKKNGELYWEHAIIAPVKDENGQITHFIAVKEDITARKQAEDLLRFQAQLLEAVGQAVVAINTQGKIVFWNRIAEAVYGWTSADAYAAPDYRAILHSGGELAVNLVEELVELAMSGKSWAGELPIRHHDRSVFPVQGTISPIFDDQHKILGCVFVANDISEQVMQREKNSLRLRIEEKLAGIAARLVKPDDFDAVIFAMLEDIAQLTESGEVALSLVDAEYSWITKAYLWKHALSQSSILEPAPMPESYYALTRSLKAGQPCMVRAELAAGQADWAGAPIRSAMRSLALDSLIFIPWQVMTGAPGYLVLVNTRQPETWFVDNRKYLVLITQLAGNAVHEQNLIKVLEENFALRTRELRSLYEMADFAYKSTGSVDFLKNAFNLVVDGLGAQRGLVYWNDAGSTNFRLVNARGMQGPASASLADEGSLAAQLATYEKPVAVLPAHDPLLAKYLPDQQGQPVHVVLMRYAGQLRGWMLIWTDALAGLDARAEDFLTTAGEKINLILENYDLREQAQVVTLMQDRQHVARELHDRVSQSLFSQNLMATAARQAHRRGADARLSFYLARLEDASLASLKEMRLLIHELHSFAVQSRGLAQTLRERLETVERRVGVDATLTIEGELQLPAAAEMELLSIIQECLNNALKHAGAARVEVRLEQTATEFQATVEDDGAGFNVSQGLASGGFGLKSIQERCRHLGAEWLVQSEPGRGARITVKLPLTQQDERHANEN